MKNEVAMLERGFKLAVRAGRLPQRPAFPVIEARNRRTGFFEEAEYRALSAHRRDEVRPLAGFMYLTGWRKSEALRLEWRSVDFGAGVLRVEDSRNGEPRPLPLRALPELAELLAEQRERTSAVEQARGIIVRHVFHRDGRPIRNFRRAWMSA